MRFKIEHAVLVRSCNVFETAYPGSLPSLSNIPSRYHSSVFPHLVSIVRLKSDCLLFSTRVRYWLI